MPWVGGMSFLPLLRGQPFRGRTKTLEYYAHPDPDVRYAANRKVEWNLIRWGNGRKRLTRPRYQPYEWTNYAYRTPVLTRLMSRELTTMVRKSRY